MLVGMALGVAVVFAVDIANESAKRAFALSLDTVTGRTTHQIIDSTDGIDESIYTRLRTELGIRNSAPVVQGDVTATAVVEGQAVVESLQLLGVDIFAEPMFRDQSTASDQSSASSGANLDSLKLLQRGSVILASTTADRLGVRIGEQFEIAGHNDDLPPTTLELINTIETNTQPGFENIAMVDISTAQEALNLQGRLSRIDLILPLPDSVNNTVGTEANGINSQTTLNDKLIRDIKFIESGLPGTRITEAARRNNSLTQMTAAFHTNLLAMSLLALLVGAFLIYNTVTLSVIQRRQTFGQLRAIGIQRHELFRSILTETLIFALIGTLAGIIIGYFLGSMLLVLVTRTINDLYFNLDVRQVDYSAFTLIKACLIGLGVSLLSALPPALEASNSPPGMVIQRTTVERRVGNLAPIIFILGIVLLGIGIAILWISSASLWAGFIALFFIVIGYSLLVPRILIAVTALGSRRTHSRSTLARSTLGNYPLRSMTASLSRTAVAIAALAISVSATAGVGIMIGSFRLSVEQWLGTTLQSDIYISANSNEVISDSVLQSFKSMDRLTGLREARMTEVESDTVPVRLMAVRDSGESQARYIFKEQEHSPAANENLTAEQRVQSLKSSNSVLISEPFANKSSLRVEDTLTLITDKGSTGFKVAGIFTNYTTGKGLAVMSMDTYHQHWNDRSISSIGISLPENTDNSDINNELRRIIAQEPLSMQSNTDIRSRSLEIFDRTFAITHVLRLLTVGVAFIGILSALMALSLERRAEYAVLRAIGITPAELRKLLIVQTGLMGLIAGVLALPLGIAMSQILVSIINVRSFGWTMQYSIPPNVLIESLVLAVIAALIAGLYPAHKLSKLSPAEALRHQ